MSTPAEIQESVAASVRGFGGFLRCEECGVQSPDLTPARIARYLGRGWPKCCGYTMHWWTQRQIDAGEAPERSAS